MLTEASVRLIAPETAVITLSGPLTLGSSLKTADAQMQSVIANGARRIVLDMTAVPYIDSAGLGTLVLTSGKTQEQGGSLRLAGVSERVLSLLKMTRTDSLLPMDATVDESLAAFGS